MYIVAYLWPALRLPPISKSLERFFHIPIALSPSPSPPPLLPLPPRPVLLSPRLEQSSSQSVDEHQIPVGLFRSQSVVMGPQQVDAVFVARQRQPTLHTRFQIGQRLEAKQRMVQSAPACSLVSAEHVQPACNMAFRWLGGSELASTNVVHSFEID